MEKRCSGNLALDYDAYENDDNNNTVCASIIWNFFVKFKKYFEFNNKGRCQKVKIVVELKEKLLKENKSINDTQTFRNIKSETVVLCCYNMSAITH